VELPILPLIAWIDQAAIPVYLKAIPASFSASSYFPAMHMIFFHVILSSYAHIIKNSGMNVNTRDISEGKKDKLFSRNFILGIRQARHCNIYFCP